MNARLIAVLACSVACASAEAQSPLVPIPFRTYVAINPLGIPFDIVSGEFETAIAPGITVGGLASYTSVDDDRFTTFDAKVRYYPGEVVLQGFSLGASLGHTRYAHAENAPSGEVIHPEASFPTLGLLVDYNWMLGARRRFIIGTGVSAKRVLASAEDRARVDIGRAYGTARFVIGIAF